MGQAKENLYEAESRIRDVDIAIETAKLVQASILQQGGASLFTQANVSSAAASQLLTS